MTLPMFFAEPGTLGTVAEGSTLTLLGDEGRHAVTVKRIQVGEQVMIADGSGLVAHCTVIETRGKDSLTVRLDSWGLPDGRTDLIVVLALIKGERMERAVEQLTEVGVGTIVPWASERSVVSLKGEAASKIHKRLERKAYEAAKQCRQPSVPVVLMPKSTAELNEFLSLDETTRDRDLVVLHEEASCGLNTLGETKNATLATQHEGSVGAVLVVGPEGGLTEGEVANFKSLGARPWVMGRNIMRTGTAAVVASGWLIGSRGNWDLRDETDYYEANGEYWEATAGSDAR